MLHKEKTSLYRQHLTAAARLRQRWLILCGGTTYAIASLWVSFRLGAPPDFAGASLALLPLLLALYGLTYARTPGPFLEINPLLLAVILGGHIVLGAGAAPQGSAARFALLFGLLAFYIVIAAPTLRSTLGALGLATLTAVGGALVYLPGEHIAFAGIEGLVYFSPALATAVIAAVCFEHERSAAFELSIELERRATSDNLTGVSNRAHINLLAQNEFARARRYREPYAALMIEIDDYDALNAKGGQRAANVVVQVFTGYCVVVMRHCDSFGRLSPARFLALLPETQGAGAFTLAGRMCRDLAALEVMVEGQPVKFTVSIGATELQVTDRWAGDLLRRAEQGLEDAIERGRGNAVFAAPPPAPAHYDAAAEDTDYIAP